MNESIWLSATEPTWMLDRLPREYGHRKYRLLGCAFCRRIWSSVPEPARRVVELAEWYADQPDTGRRIPDELINEPMAAVHRMQGERPVGLLRNGVSGLRYSWPRDTAVWTVISTTPS